MVNQADIDATVNAAVIKLENEIPGAVAAGIRAQAAKPAVERGSITLQYGTVVAAYPSSGYADVLLDGQTTPTPITMLGTAVNGTRAAVLLYPGGSVMLGTVNPTATNSGLTNWYNVKSYGATGDGTSNDTAAVQAAHDACFNAGGGVLYFPPGTYRCTLTLGTGVTVQGDGVLATILQQPNGVNDDVIQTTNFADPAMFVPAYYYPSGVTNFWPQTNAAAPYMIIANPASGPGTTADANYVTVINAALAAGIRIFGYVDTGHATGTPSAATIAANITTWYSLYGVTDIFFDNVATALGSQPFYAPFYTQVKQTPNAKLMLNHGAVPDQSYTLVGDYLVVFEGTQTSYAAATFPAWFTQYDPGMFAAIIYSVASSATMAADLLTLATQHIGRYYITDAAGFTTLSAYAATEQPNPTMGVAQSNFAIRNLSIDGNKANQAPNGAQCGIRIFGYDFEIQNVHVRNAKNHGILSTWASYTLGTDSMESTLIDVKTHDNGTNGIYWTGPHDSMWFGCISFQNAGAGFYIANNGNALVATSCHSWGNSQFYAWYIAAQALCYGCTAEGAIISQVIIDANDVTWNGGQIYAAGGGPTGISLGVTGGPARVSCSVYTEILNCTSGAVNFVSDGGNNRFDILCFQVSGNAIAGTRNGGTHFRCTMSGGGTGTQFLVASGGMFVSGGMHIGTGGSLVVDNLVQSDLHFDIGYTVAMSTGSNAKFGQATLVAGKVQVFTSALVTNSVIWLSRANGAGTALGQLTAPSNPGGTAFLVGNWFFISALSAGGTVQTNDTSVVNWWIIDFS